MGSQPSVLEQHGFTAVRGEGNATLAKSQEGDQYLVRQINDNIEDVKEALKIFQHPHIIGHQKSFEDGDTFYVLVDYFEGGDLSKKIQAKRESGEQFTEEEIKDWIVKVCMALRHLHTKNIVHRDVRPQNIFLTGFGTVCLGELLEIKERAGEGGCTGELTYVAPEVLKGDAYHDRSDMWSLGCLLYELCMTRTAFSAESAVALVPRILSGAYAPLPKTFSRPLRRLLGDLLQTDPQLRPSAQEILARPFIIAFLTAQSERTVAELQDSLQKLRVLADGLESWHFGTTVGSLTGGVIGAAGGITSIVGLILAPFTLGASLIVTGVGVGVAVAGGATAGVSNITNMVNQSTDRHNVKNIIREFQEKMNSVVVSLRHICEGLEALNLSQPAEDENEAGASGNVAKAGIRIGRGLGGIPELMRLAQVAKLGKMAAQTARAVRAVEVATGIFSVFFLAVDAFFIAMDAKEIHDIRQTWAEASNPDGPIQLQLLDGEDAQDTGTGEAKPEVKSETMKFVLHIRETATQLQEILDELSDIITFLPKVEA